MRSKELQMITQAFANVRTNRRSFLKSTLIGAAALALPQLVKAKDGSLPKIVIVGSGVSGLSAAYFLQKQGIKAEIYEGSFRVGGRMFTYQNVFEKKASTDLGGEFIDTNHLDLIALAQELGVELYDLSKDPLLENTVYIGKKFYTEKQISEALLPYVDSIEKDLAQLPAIFHYADNQSFKELDALSVTEYLDSRKIKGWIRTLIEIAITTEYGCEASLQSALNFLTILEVPQKSSTDYKLLGKEHETYKYKGGAESLITKLNEKVGQQVKLNHLLTKVKSNENGKTTLSFSAPEGDISIEADIVLLTVPFSVLRSLELDFPMSQAKQMAINELGYSNASKFILGFNEKTWRNAKSQGYIYSDTTIPSGWDSTQMQAGKRGALAVFLGGKNAEFYQEKSEKEVTNAFLNDLEKMFPKSKQAFNHKTLQFIWKDYPYSLGAYSVYLKGQWAKFVGAEAEPCGNVFFAGEHTSIEFQGFMNGAVNSAKLAVNQIIKKLAEIK